MKNQRNIFLILLMALMVFFSTIIKSVAIEPPVTDYERYYPKYLDSKLPLAAIQSNDIAEIRKSAFLSVSVPAPMVMPYGALPIQQLDIYRAPENGRSPVIFFIHAGAGDKRDVRNAIPA